MADELTKFDYLLNAVDHAAAQKNPADHDYRGKREALFAHVRELERLAHHAERAAAREGWVLVPEEPTIEMLEAADDVWFDNGSERERHVYKAMLARRPAPGGEQQ